jgi:hypothetical protein
MQLCQDGFVRLSLDDMLSTPLMHLISGVDEEVAPAPEDCGKPTTVSGYTEWLSAAEPIIVMGWDWRVDFVLGQPQWTRVGLPRSNIMLVDEGFRDLGWNRNLEVLATVVDAMDWAQQAQKSISERYA